MPRATSGLTATSTQNFVVDAGAVYLNLGETGERVLGATQGGSTFSIEQDVKVIEIDGTRGNTKGARRIITSNAGMKVGLLEMTTANLLLAIAGSSATDYTDTSVIGGGTPATTPTHDQIRRTRNLSDLDYLTNIALVGKVSGTDQNIICMLYNALNDDKLEMKMEDKKEMTLEVTFSAHYDPSDVMTEPWAIFFPKAPTT
jgi:hypothetical protein